jgi:hypothetical protein
MEWRSQSAGYTAPDHDNDRICRELSYNFNLGRMLKFYPEN